MHRHGGWQLQAVFHVYQHRDHVEVLYALKDHFGCGSIRSKGPRSDVMTFAVSDLRSLCERIVPYFQAVPLHVKRKDFAAFARIVEGLRRKEHLTNEGFELLVRLAYRMNANGKQRARTLGEVLAGTSETARQARSTAIPSTVKI